MAKAKKQAPKKSPGKSKYDITVKPKPGMTPDELLKLAINTPIKKKKS